MDRGLTALGGAGPQLIEAPSSPIPWTDANGSTGIRRRRLLSSQTIRLACHAVVATPFIAACSIEMAHGWVPQGDDAAIVFRSWLALSTHPPLVGQLTHVTAHAVFDPGPLLFWLLAIPVHLDPLQGGLWGATLLCVVGVSLAVEAGLSAYGRAGAVGVVVVVMIMLAEYPALALDPTWNAHMGLVWFMTTGAIAWAVAVGRMRWWPFLVVAASFAAQCHLMFAVGSLSCVLIAPIIGFAHRRPLRQWLPGGILAGVACWCLPLYQQLTSHPGNMTLLLRSGQGTGRPTGLSFGLRAFGASVGPHPLWWGRGQVPAPELYALAHIVKVQSPKFGVAALVILVLCVGIAWCSSRRELARLALIILVLALASVWTLSSVPDSQKLTLVYILPGAWPVGIAVLVIGLWSLGTLTFGSARWLWGLARSQRRLRPRRQVPRSVVALATSATAAALVVVSSAFVVHASAVNKDLTEGWPAMQQVTVAIRETEHVVPRGRLVVLSPPGFNDSYAIIAGLDFQLFADGWRPESPPGFPTLIGPQVAITSPVPAAKVTVIYNGGPVMLTFLNRSHAGPAGRT